MLLNGAERSRYDDQLFIGCTSRENENQTLQLQHYFAPPK